MKTSILLFGTLLALLFINSCKKEDQPTIDKQIIEKYIKDNNITTAKEHSSGLFYVIDQEGTGANPTVSSSVTVKYLGKLVNGTRFDQDTTGITFPLTQVIEGWQIGIPLFKKGGKGTLMIPSNLGYGNRASGSIPANSVLIFTVELLDFQ